MAKKNVKSVNTTKKSIGSIDNIRDSKVFQIIFAIIPVLFAFIFIGFYCYDLLCMASNLEYNNNQMLEHKQASYIVQPMAIEELGEDGYVIKIQPDNTFIDVVAKNNTTICYLAYFYDSRMLGFLVNDDIIFTKPPIFIDNIDIDNNTMTILDNEQSYTFDIEDGVPFAQMSYDGENYCLTFDDNTVVKIPTFINITSMSELNETMFDEDGNMVTIDDDIRNNSAPIYHITSEYQLIVSDININGVTALETDELYFDMANGMFVKNIDKDYYKTVLKDQKVFMMIFAVFALLLMENLMGTIYKLSILGSTQYKVVSVCCMILLIFLLPITYLML